MARIEVNDQVKILTAEAEYLFTPKNINGKKGYTLLKTKDLSDGLACTQPVGWEYSGVSLHLEVGKRLILGEVVTNDVLKVTPVNPHH